MNIQMNELHGISIHDKQILLDTLKALMLKTPTTIIKKIKLHLMQDILYVQSMNKKKVQVGWVATIWQNA